MKIKELIKELEKVEEEHGNLEVSHKVGNDEKWGEIFHTVEKAELFTFRGMEREHAIILKSFEYNYD